MSRKVLVLATALLFCGLGPALSITVLPISEEELTERATVIVTGTVDNVESRYDDQRRTIFTYVDLDLDRVLKGSPGADHITLRQMGGTVGDETVEVFGSPAWELGEEVMVFAGPLGDTGYYGVLGIFYGKYDIERDPGTGQSVVTGASFETVHTDPVTFEQLPERERPEKVSLEDFIAEITSYIEQE